MIRGFITQLTLTWQLMRDPRVPLWTKIVPIAALLYIVSPFDFIPDIIPGLGQLDDLGILLVSMRLMESISPEMVVIEYRRRLNKD